MKDELEEMRDWAVSRLEMFLPDLQRSTDPIKVQETLYSIMVTAEHAHGKFSRATLIEEGQKHGTLPA